MRHAVAIVLVAFMSSPVVAGPDDPVDWLDGPDRLRLLLREVFTACGGTHDDWDAYDRTMVDQRRTAVLVDPSRVYSNG